MSTVAPEIDQQLPDAVRVRVRQFNVAYLMLVQSIGITMPENLRLIAGAKPEVIDEIMRLTPVDAFRFGDVGWLLCRPRFDDAQTWARLRDEDYDKNALLQALMKTME